MGAERRVDGAAGEPVAQEAPATLYERLGVDLHAPDERIRAAYIRLAKQTHPDRHRGGDWLSAQRRFQRIQEAYEVLMDPERRSAYDLQLLHLMDAEEYVDRFHELVLTVNGLGLAAPRGGRRAWHDTELDSDSDTGGAAGGPDAPRGAPAPAPQQQKQRQRGAPPP
ncbi:MAG: DnaJ domain-containing protein [Monoraphidium minutum]|nr:MAG: DnaJ domain-containing protein [Monoraphidium minutum]